MVQQSNWCTVFITKGLLELLICKSHIMQSRVDCWWLQLINCWWSKRLHIFKSSRILYIINNDWWEHDHNDYKMTNKAEASSVHIKISLVEKWGELGGGIQWDADLNMINGGPGLQIPSSSRSQSACDRLPLKVAPAITAHTHRLFLPRAQEGRLLGAA